MEDTKTVYAFHPVSRVYLRPIELSAERGDMDPLEPGRWLVPGNCLETEPPLPQAGQEAYASGDEWALRSVALPPAPPVPAPLTVDQRIAALLARVDAHLNAGAAERRYSSIHTAALRAGYPGPFHHEGVAYATWMDATYARCYEILAQWEAGDIEEPTADELIAMLPAFTPPAGE